ncbi:hypothetical protein [Peribacillus sp. SCS-37]|uniref:hypothetical protein n=1 Tax=Paraperibacillus esterisolvens TaxID=3115296 RepID=UPI003906096D
MELDDDEEFAVDFVTVEINEYTDMIEFLFFTFEDRAEVYFCLYDDGEAPFRNILGKGTAATIDEAAQLAKADLDKQAYSILC